MRCEGFEPPIRRLIVGSFVRHAVFVDPRVTDLSAKRRKRSLVASTFLCLFRKGVSNLLAKELPVCIGKGNECLNQSEIDTLKNVKNSIEYLLSEIPWLYFQAMKSPQLNRCLGRLG